MVWRLALWTPAEWQTTSWDATIFGSAEEGSITLAIPEAIPYTVDRWHVRNALIGSNLSRAYFGFYNNGDLYGVDLLHQGSGADCRLSSTALSTATRIQVSISSGAQGADTVVAAIIAQLEANGILGATASSTYTIRGVEFCNLTIPNSSGLNIGEAMPLEHESTQGLWGAQRTDFGTGDVDGMADGGATTSTHIRGPNASNRIIAVVALQTDGNAAMQLAVGSGPAHSSSPTAFTLGGQGIATIGTDGIRVFPLAEPMYQSALAHAWVSTRFVSGGNPRIAFRVQGQTIPGNGDLTIGETLLSDTRASNPNTPIYSSGTYTYSPSDAAPGSPFAVYSRVGYVYETPQGGAYSGDGALAALWGFHGPIDLGTPTSASAEVLAELTETFRITVPLTCQLDSVTVGMLDVDPDEDASLAIYDWSEEDLDEIPVSGTPDLLRDHGACGLTAAGWNTITLSTPLLLSAGQVIGVCASWSNGVTTASSYDAPGAADAYLTGWVDNGRQWSDLVDSGTGDRGNRAQYMTLADGDMPTGDGPATVWPAEFDSAASDFFPENQWRFRLALSRPGIQAV